MATSSSGFWRGSLLPGGDHFSQQHCHHPTPHTPTPIRYPIAQHCPEWAEKASIQHKQTSKPKHNTSLTKQTQTKHMIERHFTSSLGLMVTQGALGGVGPLLRGPKPPNHAHFSRKFRANAPIDGRWHPIKHLSSYSRHGATRHSAQITGFSPEL